MARRHSLPINSRSVSFDATIDVCIISARPHASDDAAQHMPTKPTMTRRNSISVTWDSEIDVRIIPARQSAPRADTIPARERDFDLRLENAEKRVQELLAMKDYCNDFDLRLESAAHSAALEDDATSWLSALSAQSARSDKPKRHTVMQPKWGGPSV